MLCRFALLFFFMVSALPAKAYSVLTHQALVDGLWRETMVPLLQEKYPNLTNLQLREAHAYAYGGAIIQDMGYYPLGSRFFTDLTHYVRTGDFVNNLLLEAGDEKEYAFALGALAHYHSDIHGHKEGTNLSVPLLYPKLKKYYGSSVTYQEDPVSHTRMEFAFDVVQASRKNYAPEAYRNFIGFKIARNSLEKAFLKTYGLHLKEIFVYVPLSGWLFRSSVKFLIPQFIKVGWYQNRIKLKENTGQALESDHLADMQSPHFRQAFSKDEEPGFTARFMSLAFRGVPKIGPLSALNFKIPTAQADTLFIRSFDHSAYYLAQSLDELHHQPALQLASYNLDTGRPTHIQDYQLADAAHRKLLNRLKRDDFDDVSRALKEYLQTFYEKVPLQPDYRKEQKEFRQIKRNLQKLSDFQPGS